MRKTILLFLFFPFCLSGQTFTGPVIATFNGVYKGSLYKENISFNDSIDLYIRDGRYTHAKVLSFGLSYCGSGWDAYKNSMGNKVTAEIAGILLRASIGSSFWIEEIKVQLDDTVIMAPPIKLIIDGLKVCLYSEFDDFALFVVQDKQSTRFGTQKEARKFHIGTDPIFGYDHCYLSRHDFLKNHYLYVYNQREHSESYNYVIKEYVVNLNSPGHSKTIIGTGNVLSHKIKNAFRRNRNINDVSINITKAIDSTGKEVEVGGIWVEIK